MDIVNKLIRDIEEGIKQSIDTVRSKAALVIEKADELTEEGKKQYRLYELRNKRQKQFSSLGEKLYRLAADKKLAISNRELTTLLSSIDKTNAAIAQLEGKLLAPAPRKTVRKKTPAKPGAAAKKEVARKTVSK